PALGEGEGVTPTDAPGVGVGVEPFVEPLLESSAQERHSDPARRQTPISLIGKHGLNWISSMCSFLQSQCIPELWTHTHYCLTTRAWFASSTASGPVAPVTMRETDVPPTFHSTAPTGLPRPFSVVTTLAVASPTLPL